MTLLEKLEKALLGVCDVSASEWDGGDKERGIPDQKETIGLLEAAIEEEKRR